jgi:hypothetical protein
LLGLLPPNISWIFFPEKEIAAAAAAAAAEKWEII